MYSQTVITHKNCPFCNYKLFIFQRLPRIKVIKKKKKKILRFPNRSELCIYKNRRYYDYRCLELKTLVIECQARSQRGYEGQSSRRN